MMEFIPNPHKIEHPAGVHMLDNQSRITLWQTEPAALLYAQMLQGCLREYAGLEVPFTRGKPRAGYRPAAKPLHAEHYAGMHHAESRQR